jgi:PAT family beta-lactamase induction signal transducer AmpG
MNQKTPKLFKKKLIFSLLYFTEGAPIGFIWLALPILFKQEGLTLKMIAQFTSLAVIPWSLKFLWAPIIDTLKSEKFTYRSWLILAQLMMVATLVPLMFLDLKADFRLISKLILVHTFFSAIQDISIDSLAINLVDPSDRGKINGWMQMGQFLGQAAFGGGAILLINYIGLKMVILSMILSILLFGIIILKSTTLASPIVHKTQNALKTFFETFQLSFLNKNALLGLAFALLFFSSQKAFTGLIGPFLLDQGFHSLTIGSFLAFPSITLMILGSLFGGYFSDHFGKKRVILICALAMGLTIVALNTIVPPYLMISILCLLYFFIGMSVTSSYSMLMNMTNPKVAATQFAAYMGMVNMCESYSLYLLGKLKPEYGYLQSYLITVGITFSALIFLYFIKLEPVKHEEEEATILGTSGTGPMRN